MLLWVLSNNRDTWRERCESFYYRSLSMLLATKNSTLNQASTHLITKPHINNPNKTTQLIWLICIWEFYLPGFILESYQ